MRRYIVILGLAVLVGDLDGAQFVPVRSYRSLEDSPFHEFGIPGTLVVEDFEDGELNVPGARLLVGQGLGASSVSIVDEYSVAADLENGAGKALQALPSLCSLTFPPQCPATVTLAFDDPPGALPNYVGFAWTDAVRASLADFHPWARVKVFEPSGGVDEIFLRELPARDSLPDDHADDIFIGYLNEPGISRLEITVVTADDRGGHFVMDHFQFGRASLPGDTNRDGDVDFADFSQLSGHFQQYPADWSNGDFDFDQLVAFRDFLMLSANFGLETMDGVAPSVPEPSSATLIWTAVLVASASARRRRGLDRRIT